MYERRLKIFFAILIAATAALLLRCAHLQIIKAADFQAKAAHSIRRPELLETTRGRILDFRNRELALDEPCLVASVDYRAIERNPNWIRELALRRLGSQYRRADKQLKADLLQQETTRVNDDLDQMWLALATVSGKSPEDIAQTQAAIRRRVEVLRRYLWYTRYNDATEHHEQAEPPPWFKRFLLSGEGAPQIDSFAIDVSEQSEPHIILSNISTETHNWLAKQLDRFPGLVLDHSKHRVYPLGETACHLLGHLTVADSDDLEKGVPKIPGKRAFPVEPPLENDPHPTDGLRRYFPNDRVGRGGIEGLCEQVLRGSRGRREWIAGDNRPVSCINPVPGKDVRITIDAELQIQIEYAFRDVKWFDEGRLVEQHEMHGAAVVIDVPTGQVRALVSYPTFDANKFADLYPLLKDDQLNKPFLNRATQLPVEPGSTIKPVVGIGAISQGLIRTDQGIECTGYLIINGKPQSVGRCWTASRAQHLPGMIAHHKIPDQDPHPDGHLVFSDALQRSCNVYFETLGDRLKVEGLSYWFHQFGLGRKTGIGIAEWPGHVPDDYTGDAVFPSMQWFAAIGQGQVAATPLQMANVAATIARDGIWVRPRLLTNDADAPPPRNARHEEIIPDRRDLKASPAAVAAAKQGMIRVVNTRAGTGLALRDPQVLIAGKTGTAQVPPLRRKRIDQNGQVVIDQNGQVVREEYPVSTREKKIPEMLWYRGTEHKNAEVSHAWFIGFAPANAPKIAFAVLLEYGGSGGADAAVVARGVLEACKEHGYLAVQN